MKYFLSTLVTLLIFTGCSQVQVNVDYDDSFNFSAQKTFVIIEEKKEGSNTLYIDRVISALESTLESKNYTKASKDNADLIFVFHTDITSKSDINTDYQRVGFGMYRYGGGMGGMVSTTSTYNYDEGTLMIDALSPKTKNIVWRGVGQTEVKKQETPQEKRKYINSIVTKIMAKFPSQIQP